MHDGRLRIGLAASACFRSGPDALLPQLVADLEPFFADVLGAELHVLGATYDAMLAAGLLGKLRAQRLPPAAEGGFIMLTALLVGLTADDPGLDWIIHLQDPRNPISLYPETQALKRQCVVHGKPFLSSAAGAYEWCVLEWFRRAGPCVELNQLVERWVRPRELGEETLALIAHDAMKPQMLAFARDHRPVLQRFGRRIATGTTGGLLNGSLPPRLAAQGAAFPGMSTSDHSESAPWVTVVRSGPQGGDAQIAREVMLGRCRRAVFLEDPHVAREHEADIQLLERATRFAAGGCLCLNGVETAGRWAENLAAVLSQTTVSSGP